MSVAYTFAKVFKIQDHPVATIFFTSGKYTRNVMPCSFICVCNDFFALEF